MPDNKPNVLIINDSKDDVEALDAILGLDYRVQHASTHEAGVDAAQADPPDVVLVAADLGTKGGYVLCEELMNHRVTQDIPVIFTAAKGDIEDDETGLRAGGADYLSKPFEAATVIARVGNLILLARYRKELAKQAPEDNLTTLATSQEMERTLYREFARAQRDGTPLSLLFVDMDRFKAYNDNHGRAAGDRCLQRVADLLKEHVQRPADFVARVGGEEFVCILPETGREGAMHLARDIREGVEQLGIPHGTAPGTSAVTLSVGVATDYPSPLSDDAEALFREADRALTEAQSAGGNRCVRAD